MCANIHKRLSRMHVKTMDGEDKYTLMQTETCTETCVHVCLCSQTHTHMFTNMLTMLTNYAY